MMPSNFDSPWNMIVNAGLNIGFYVFGVTLFMSIIRGIFGGQNSMGGGPMIPGVPSTNSINVVDKSSLNTTFADVAGCDEAKYELVEVVDFLKFLGKYTDAGAKYQKEYY